ncbi:MAG: flagellar type III secretion system pore protein FliP, partial [Eubacteriales bacterium]|nr:flagellar type III secretion system pore protein FliP [Eubacteriales bacterium]
TGVQEEEDKGLLARLFGMFDSRSESIQIVALLTVLSLAPSILMMFTSFVRIVMVLSFTRNALGLQNMPPNQVIIGLALFLSFFVMSPVIQEIKTEAVIPYVAEAIDLEEATERGVVPIKNFMLRQTRQTDLEMFYSFSDEAMPENIEETKLEILTPAFLTSELRRAFEIGFFIYIPFIVIDMIVASTLMAMGMMMLPPVTISLPFKVLLFVVVDGWALTIGSLLSSFG